VAGRGSARARARRFRRAASIGAHWGAGGRSPALAQPIAPPRVPSDWAGAGARRGSAPASAPGIGSTPRPIEPAPPPNWPRAMASASSAPLQGGAEAARARAPPPCAALPPAAPHSRPRTMVARAPNLEQAARPGGVGAHGAPALARVDVKQVDDRVAPRARGRRAASAGREKVRGGDQGGERGRGSGGGSGHFGSKGGMEARAAARRRRRASARVGRRGAAAGALRARRDNAPGRAGVRTGAERPTDIARAGGRENCWVGSATDPTTRPRPPSERPSNVT
jgi:hypothetical protein